MRTRRFLVRCVKVIGFFAVYGIAVLHIASLRLLSLEATAVVVGGGGNETEASSIYNTSTASTALSNNNSKKKEPLIISAKILHVVPLYRVENCQEPYCPFDQAQSLAVASIQKAMNATTNTTIIAAAVTMQGEEEVIPNNFIQLPSLNRSTKSHFSRHRLQGEKELPFLQDILNAANRTDARRIIIDYEYMVYTNSDIIVHRDFYNIVQERIDTLGLDLFTMNRRTVPDRSATDPYTALDLDYIFNTQEGEVHPGHDCFVMSRPIIQSLHIGDIFLGAAYVSNILLLHATLHSTHCRNYASHEQFATYHIGNEQAWKSNSGTEYMLMNFYNSICVNRTLIDVCAQESTFPCRQEACRMLREKTLKWLQLEWNHDTIGPWCHTFETKMTNLK